MRSCRSAVCSAGECRPVLLALLALLLLLLLLALLT
jgi:hypothetical protein